ncbi:MAG: deoxyribodipyrimidine photolyase [Myxococcales bacterium]|nr:deoxyribodipyrimidine photolyase [Myxococcales bacterium]MCB9749028.1 deoxyribodipyrimidine photolyase [Myxococcales bacterium]
MTRSTEGTITEIPAARLRAANDRPVRPDGDYVLYWMISSRRTRYSFALERAVARCAELDKPLLVLEALRHGYRWACDRHHDFVLDGMLDNLVGFERAGVRYYPFVEGAEHPGAGLLAALAERACVVVTDEFPCFFLPRMVAAAARRVDVRLEVVDGNGLLPLRAAGRVFTTAASFRRHLQKTLPEHLARFPAAEPLRALSTERRAVIPRAALLRWPPVTRAALESGRARLLASLPIDHAIAPAPIAGGAARAERACARFLAERLTRYGEQRNEPGADVASGLSPYLHFGHISTHDVVARLIARERWDPGALAPRASGSRHGWWGMSSEAESFLDELVTWRELGYVFCDQRPRDYDRYASLPSWARQTLEDHEGDERPHLYTRAQLDEARTHDPLWNAAQTQLREEGRVHNYLRMLWGKKILEWSPSPQHALDALIELNNRYALDGRNPNSYSGIFWTLGRFDRAWGPERPIFGKVRYMSSENTARKLDTKPYLARWGSQRALLASARAG